MVDANRSRPWSLSFAPTCRCFNRGGLSCCDGPPRPLAAGSAAGYDCATPAVLLPSSPSPWPDCRAQPLVARAATGARARDFVCRDACLDRMERGPLCTPYSWRVCASRVESGLAPTPAARLPGRLLPAPRPSVEANMLFPPALMKPVVDVRSDTFTSTTPPLAVVYLADTRRAAHGGEEDEGGQGLHQRRCGGTHVVFDAYCCDTLLDDEPTMVPFRASPDTRMVLSAPAIAGDAPLRPPPPPPVPVRRGARLEPPVALGGYLLRPLAPAALEPGRDRVAARRPVPLRSMLRRGCWLTSMGMPGLRALGDAPADRTASRRSVPDSGMKTDGRCVAGDTSPLPLRLALEAEPPPSGAGELLNSFMAAGDSASSRDAASPLNVDDWLRRMGAEPTLSHPGGPQGQT